MSLETWWLFVMMSFVVSATPGPNMLLVMSCSARYGMRASFAAMAGCLCALIAMMSISAAGLGALLQAFPRVFDALRWIGAAYLAWLGWRSWRAPVEAADADAAQPQSPQPVARAALFYRGMLVAASNPKAILFAAAFLPQFIAPSRPALPQFAILLASFALIESGWYLVYAAGGRRIAARLRQAPVMRAFNRLTGGAFIGFGALMAALRH
jgi:threonine/homoserine/homoserine lactone efflux protein